MRRPTLRSQADTPAPQPAQPSKSGTGGRVVVRVLGTLSAIQVAIALPHLASALSALGKPGMLNFSPLLLVASILVLGTAGLTLLLAILITARGPAAEFRAAAASWVCWAVGAMHLAFALLWLLPFPLFAVAGAVLYWIAARSPAPRARTLVLVAPILPFISYVEVNLIYFRPEYRHQLADHVPHLTIWVLAAVAAVAAVWLRDRRFPPADTT